MRILMDMLIPAEAHHGLIVRGYPVDDRPDFDIRFARQEYRAGSFAASEVQDPHTPTGRQLPRQNLNLA